MLIVIMSARLIDWDKQTGLEKGAPSETIETVLECFKVGMGPRVGMSDKDCRKHLLLHVLVHTSRASTGNIWKLEKRSTWFHIIRQRLQGLEHPLLAELTNHP